MIRNVPEGFDDVDKLSYEQTSSSWLRLTAAVREKNLWYPGYFS